MPTGVALLLQKAGEGIGMVVIGELWRSAL